MDVKLVAAESLPHAERAALWTEAFSDYFTPGVITAETLSAMELMFDLDRSASRILVEDGRPVAFAMLGIRGPARDDARAPGDGAPETRGWIGGMGVVPSARRRGYGDRVMLATIEAARERGLATVRLEVLVQNVAAIPLYERLGFRTLRKVEVWERTPETPAPVPDVEGREIPLDEVAGILGREGLDGHPWQREFGAARRVFPDLSAFAADSGSARAVVVHRTLADRVGVIGIGVSPAGGADSERALDRLLASFFATRSGRAMRLLNLPEHDPASRALERAGATVTHRQWEMELAL